jgi:hypothetical protein
MGQNPDSTEVETMRYEENIGKAAGKVWTYLKEHGKSSLSGIEKGVDAPRGVVFMAPGWLAREGKLEFAEEKRTTQVWLR